MAYDFQLVGGVLLLILSAVGIANAMVEQRSPLYSVIGILIGGALIVWAWFLSGQALAIQDLPNAVFRLLAIWL
ncbi:MAG: hypothetical protein KUG74_04060 [Rhodobacteraceae bacterium]|nr:hypothetical protein [Paracoccaceae bacterium]